MKILLTLILLIPSLSWGLDNIQIIEDKKCNDNEVAEYDYSISEEVCVPTFPLNYMENYDELNGFKGRLQESCSGQRKLDIETKYVNEFRVDAISMDYDNFNEYCDENRITISLNQYSLSEFDTLEFESSKIIYDKFVGTGASYIPGFLEGQSFILKNYVWYQFCPGTVGCLTKGFFVNNNQIKVINIDDEINCKYVEESVLECYTLTEREDFNSLNPKCSRANFPYDATRLHFEDGNLFKREIVSQMPIPEACQKINSIEKDTASSENNELKDGCKRIEDMSTGKIEVVCQ